MADEKDLDLFSVFTVSSFSVLLVDLDLPNELDLSNDLLLPDALLMDSSFFTFRCFWFVCFADGVKKYLQ